MPQKYYKGDHVRFNDYVEPCTTGPARHMGQEGIILFSSGEEIGKEGGDYRVYIKDRGPSCWHREKAMDLIEHNRWDLIKKWEKKPGSGHIKPNIPSNKGPFPR